MAKKNTRRIDELERICAELYQVIGVLAYYAGVSGHIDVNRAMDNASRHRLVHRDLLPWPTKDLPKVRRTNRL